MKNTRASLSRLIAQLGCAVVAVLCIGPSLVFADTPAELARGFAIQQAFREANWPKLRAQGWEFITYAGGVPGSDAPELDWFFQSVRDRGNDMRSAWVLDVHYEPVGKDLFPDTIDAPHYQSEKALWWVSCKEISAQVRIWHRYKDAFGVGPTVTGLIFPKPIDLSSSAPMELIAEQPNTIGETLVKAICAAPIK